MEVFDSEREAKVTFFAGYLVDGGVENVAEGVVLTLYVLDSTQEKTSGKGR